MALVDAAAWVGNDWETGRDAAMNGLTDRLTRCELCITHNFDWFDVSGPQQLGATKPNGGPLGRISHSSSFQNASDARLDEAADGGLLGFGLNRPLKAGPSRWIA